MSEAAPTAWAGGALPNGAIGRNSVGWWGALCAIGTEAFLFVYLLFSYAYYDVVLDPSWIPGDMQHPSLHYALPGVVALLLSSLAAFWAERSVQRARRSGVVIGFAIAFVLGCIFFALQCLDWSERTFSLRTGEYGSIFYTITGLHLAHLAAGLLALLTLMVWAGLGYFDEKRHLPVLIGVAYWHFVVAVGVVVFVALYLTPYLG
jgi:cytochrome c oxidase subunit 3